MRKLTRNEVLELRACKGMDNGHLEFFERAERFYADDPEALERLEKMRHLYMEVEDIPFEDIGAYGAYMKSTEMYYQYMDSLLSEMGYTSKDEA